jgi:hypothetical protein
VHQLNEKNRLVAALVPDWEKRAVADATIFAKQKAIQVGFGHGSTCTLTARTKERSMKPILLLTDEIGTAEPTLQNIAAITVKLRQSAGTPGCNCDRWGHPCADSDEGKIQRKTELPISSPAERHGIV